MLKEHEHEGCEGLQQQGCSASSKKALTPAFCTLGASFQKSALGCAAPSTCRMHPSGTRTETPALAALLVLNKTGVESLLEKHSSTKKGNRHAQTQTHTDTQTHRHTQTHTDTHRHTQTHTHTYTYTHTHTQTHTQQRFPLKISKSTKHETRTPPIELIIRNHNT